MNVIGKLWMVCREVWGRLNGWYRYRADLLHGSLLRQLTKGRPPIGLPVILLAMALALTLWPGSAKAADCFRYGEVVTLSGHYFAEVAPPDDGIVRSPVNDAARRATLLKLTTPFCVDADIVSRGVLAAASIQLFCPAIHAADGSQMSIHGRLAGAHTHSGQTPVLLRCL